MIATNSALDNAGHALLPGDATLRDYAEALRALDPHLIIEQISARHLSEGRRGAICIPRARVLGQQVLFKDAAGTDPVLYDGDPVGLMLDLGPHKLHRWQDLSAKRVIYRAEEARGLYWLDSSNGGFFNFEPMNLNNGAMFLAAEAPSLSGTSIFLSGFGSGYFHFGGGGEWRKNFKYVDTPERLSINASKAQRVNLNGGTISIRRNDSDIEYTNSDEASTSGMSSASTLFAYPGGGSATHMKFFGGIFLEHQIPAAEEQVILDYLARLH
ncbi:hypothetical protein ACGLWX_09720 [Halomonas sp. HMF6819]|uniref:hypothetical protein n=1 Tax=Halomonas sp. HMF6819 TaxID=3373085 RepID=UPI00379CD312